MRLLKIFFATVFLFLAQAPAFAAQVIILDNDIDQIQSRINLIKNAKNQLYVSTFIFGDDQVGAGFQFLLAQAAQRGVDVRLLVDHSGTKIPPEAYAWMSEQGVKVKIFNMPSILRPSSYWRRMHDKLLIIDHQFVMTGSRNLTDGFDIYRSIDHERDLFVQSFIHAKAAEEHYLEVWNHKFSTDVATLREVKKINSDQLKSYRHHILEEVARVHKEPRLDFNCLVFDFGVSISLQDGIKCNAWKKNVFEIADQDLRFVGDHIDNLGSMSMTAKEHVRMILNAKAEILIENPYVILHKQIYYALQDVRRNNSTLNIRVFTNSIATNDEGWAQAGFEDNRNQLENLNVELRELMSGYTLHSKAMVVDGSECYVGSFNMDPRSYELNSETGFIATNAHLCMQLRGYIEKKLQTTAAIINGKIDGTHEAYPSGVSKEEIESLKRRQRLSRLFKSQL